MSKKPITWIELIKEKINLRKADNKPAGVKDVMTEAKGEWNKIKAGKHEKYIQGKPSGPKTKKSKKSKKSKNSNKSVKKSHNKTVDLILKKCKLCDECKKEIMKFSEEHL